MKFGIKFRSDGYIFVTWEGLPNDIEFFPGHEDTMQASDVRFGNTRMNIN